MTFNVIRSQGPGEEMTSVPYWDYFLTLMRGRRTFLPFCSCYQYHFIPSCTHAHTAPSKTTDRLTLSSMSEPASVQSDSGRADPRTTTTWPGAWALNGLSALHQQWYTDKPSQGMDLNGKWSCVRSHSLFLQRSTPTSTRIAIATCWLTRAGAAS